MYIHIHTYSNMYTFIYTHKNVCVCVKYIYERIVIPTVFTGRFLLKG